MSGGTLPPLPQQLKAVQHYLKTATEHDKRDPVVSYYCRLYALQSGMELDKKSPECRTFHVALMDYLEKVKKQLNNEAIHNEVVGQAHMENYALKVFLYADNEDRAGRFNKNVVKSFYTAGMLFDTLSVFGELSEDIDKNRKYAKWKAAYIHKCLKSGETPVSGPLDGDESQTGGAPVGFDQPGTSQSNQPDQVYYSETNNPGPTYQPGPSPSQGQPDFRPLPNDPSRIVSNVPSTTLLDPPKNAADMNSHSVEWKPPKNASGVQLTSQQYQQAFKLCKFASSALQYEDSKTAIDNLSKALSLLTTGKEC